MESTSLPWEDGDPPDDGMQVLHVALGGSDRLLHMTSSSGRRSGGDVMVPGSSSCGDSQAGIQVPVSSSSRRSAGHGCESSGTTREPGDAHEVITPDGFDDDLGEEHSVWSHEQQMQLDLGLTDITKFFSYSKLWRTLYFVNDAPFRIRNHERVLAGD